MGAVQITFEQQEAQRLISNAVKSSRRRSQQEYLTREQAVQVLKFAQAKAAKIKTGKFFITTAPTVSCSCAVLVDYVPNVIMGKLEADAKELTKQAKATGLATRTYDTHADAEFVRSKIKEPDLRTMVSVNNGQYILRVMGKEP